MTAADAQLTPGRRLSVSAVMMVVVALDLGRHCRRRTCTMDSAHTLGGRVAMML